MTKKSKKTGRPTKYKPEYCDKLIEFFDIPFYKEVEIEKMSASGVVKTIQEKRPNDFPMLEDFCWEIDICPDTIANWCKEYPEFFRAVRKAKAMQKRFLTKHGLGGGYKDNFARFIAVNLTDYVDKSEVKTENEHNVKGYGLAFDLNTPPEEL